MGNGKVHAAMVLTAGVNNRTLCGRPSYSTSRKGLTVKVFEWFWAEYQEGRQGESLRQLQDGGPQGSQPEKASRQGMW